jgi:hypothetical protein
MYSRILDVGLDLEVGDQLFASLPHGQRLVGILQHLLAGPVDGPAGAEVELLGGLGMQGSVLVVAHDQGVHALGALQTFPGIRAVADDVAEADDLLDALGIDVGQNGLQGLQVAVNVGKHSLHLVRPTCGAPRQAHLIPGEQAI